MIIRWLGAYRRGGESLAESFQWEFRQTGRKILAAERLQNRRSRMHNGATVGLLVPNRAVVRRFSGDVWSEQRNGHLRATRSQEGGSHSPWEAWVRPEYIGIIIRKPISGQGAVAIRDIAEKTGLPVLRLTRDGQLIPGERWVCREGAK